MVVNVYVMKDMMWWVCSVYVMVWLLVIDVIDVHIGLIPITMEHNVFVLIQEINVNHGNTLME